MAAGLILKDKIEITGRLEDSTNLSDLYRFFLMKNIKIVLELAAAR